MVRAERLQFTMKKLINDPNPVSVEVVEGTLLAFPDLIRQVGGHQSVIRRDELIPKFMSSFLLLITPDSCGAPASVPEIVPSARAA